MNANTEFAAAVPQARADARSRAYSLFAQAFRYPEREVFEALKDGSYVYELHDALAIALPQLANDFQNRFAPLLTIAGDIADFEASYLAAFENNLPLPSVSLYEGSYGARRGEKAALMLELKGFYRNFGLAMAANDLEDALTAELEFMQFLAAKQALAEEGALDRKPYVLAQRDFLERHLAAWLPALRTAITANLKQPFFPALADLASEFVTQDTAEMVRDADRLTA